jgi:hypothetical protein
MPFYYTILKKNVKSLKKRKYEKFHL